MVCFVFFFKWCTFESGLWKSIPVHAENMAKSSPSSLLHLIDDVVDVGVFCDFFVSYSRLPTYFQDFSEASSFKTSQSAEAQ